MPLLASLALSYALVLVAPGPNLLIVLRVAVRPSWGRLLSVAAGIASGAAIASYLAAIGATSLYMLDDLDMWASVVLSSILLYSAVRLARRPLAGAPSQQLGSDSLSLRLYSLGLATALSNPLSVPFFVGLYLAQPDFRTGMGEAATCIIFVMAFSWFTLVGCVFSVPAIQRLDAIWVKTAQTVLAAAMGLYGLILLFEHVL
ncbi:lysine transporter LysE (plasmid) [Rhizobium ruizarguesonis]|uniref:Lysine transporter LysE n=1 Tax=Rhizobium ruizarguesonis TaxID=2081791 RepID=A0ABY1X295_9HYPH|nr:LysE family transporter [Rhizobium ruizarguesonis]QIO48584.1 LysE family transporter [Rhizobium leguminosarum bv. trifolii]TBY57195.1 lysine transporter LysE [Rhizobium leguminosarum bv. viciae]TAU17781.1 lysine transporter LysE [Rhizobium ruizarguesonis]TAU59646.1 lysine transporter LysE [Rhizobium ruizarguesonis]TAU71847.1 lysine transporter LysE [Rhizobium ruizarguesonis]